MSPGVALLLVFEAWRGDHPDAVSRRAGVRLNVHRGRGGSGLGHHSQGPRVALRFATSVFSLKRSFGYAAQVR